MKPYDSWSSIVRGSPLEFTTPRNFRKRPPRRFIVDDLIAVDEVSVIYGAPEAGKSNLAAYLACCVASTRPFFGRSAGVLPVTDRSREEEPEDPAPCGVLYLALERAAQVERRIRTYATEHRLQFEMPIAVVESSFDLREANAGDRIASTAWAAHDAITLDGDYKPPFDLVIIDTLARGLADGSDGDPGDLGRAIKSVDRVRELIGAHVAVVHHTPLSDATRMRGHTSLLGAVDLTISVERKRTGHVAQVRKTSDGYERPAFTFSLKNVESMNGNAPLVVEGAVTSRTEEHPEPDVGPRMPETQIEALEALQAAALDEDGEPVSLDAWRAKYMDKTSDAKEATRRVRFSRAKAALLAAGVVGSDDDMWFVTS